MKLTSRPERAFWTVVWEASELCHIGLGRFAPFVFGRMIGVRGKRVDESEGE